MLSSTSSNITWSEPFNKSGEILSYQVRIFTLGPLHHIPTDGCTWEYDNDLTEEVKPDTLFYVFDNGLPNFYYTVSIRAETSVGYGADSRVDFTTPSQSKHE